MGQEGGGKVSVTEIQRAEALGGRSLACEGRVCKKIKILKNKEKEKKKKKKEEKVWLRIYKVSNAQIVQYGFDSVSWECVHQLCDW